MLLCRFNRQGDTKNRQVLNHFLAFFERFGHSYPGALYKADSP